ncbi:MAG: Mpo1-like protein, partial [Cyclobacteriaceae bacterium]
MRRIDELLAEYGESHQNATNKAIHWICVPLIFF